MFGLWRVLIEIDNVVLVILEVFLAKAVNDRLAILLLLVCSLMSKAAVSKIRTRLCIRATH